MSNEVPGETPNNEQQANIASEPAYKYDIAVSFAGEQRDFVADVVRGLNLPKDRVFYDADYKAELLGEDLAEVFTKLYRDEARYVAMFISREYAEKEWCRLERKAALRRRMMTKGAYILPIRLDTTKLDEVEGLLGSIGDLDGLREGVPGVAEVLRQKLALVLSEANTGASDGAQEFGEIVYDAAGLEKLANTKPHSWQWALFGSVLVQRRAALKEQLRDHTLGFAPQSGERITALSELVQLLKDSMHDLEQNSFQLVALVQTPAFKAAFGEPIDLADDPESIVHLANRVMDYYDRYLKLAQRVRGVAAPADYITVLDTCAQISNKPLAGMNQFIDAYAKAVEEMPKRLIEANGENIELSIELPLNPDNDLFDEVLRQLRQLVDEADDGD